MTIDFKKTPTNEVDGVSTINTIIMHDSSKLLPDLINYRASSDKLLSIEDFSEYGMDFLPTKYKFNSISPLEFMSDESKELVGGYYSDLSVVSKVFFPTLSKSEVSESGIYYFGSISISDQTLLLVNCPPGYDEIYIYDKTISALDKVNWNILVRLGGDISKDTGEFTKYPANAFEIPSYKIVWIVTSPSGKVKNINLSYKAWSDSINPFRNLVQGLLRNDEFYKIKAGPEVVENVKNTTLWFDKNSSTVLGNILVNQSPLLSERLFNTSSILSSSSYSSEIVYGKGDVVTWGGTDWVSLVDNNRGSICPSLSSSWAKSDKLTDFYYNILNLTVTPGFCGNLSTSSLSFNKASTHDITFHLDLKLGYRYRTIKHNTGSDYDPNQIILDYTRKSSSIIDSGSALGKYNGGKSTSYRKYFKVVGSDFDGYDITIAPLVEGNIEDYVYHYSHFEDFIGYGDEDGSSTNVSSSSGSSNIVYEVPYTKWSNQEYLNYFWSTIIKEKNSINIDCSPSYYRARVFYRYSNQSLYYSDVTYKSSINPDMYNPVYSYRFSSDGGAIAGVSEGTFRPNPETPNSNLDGGGTTKIYEMKADIPFKIDVEFVGDYSIESVTSYYITKRPPYQSFEEIIATDTPVDGTLRNIVDNYGVLREGIGGRLRVNNSKLSITDKVGANGDIFYIVDLSQSIYQIIVEEFFGMDLSAEKISVSSGSNGVLTFIPQRESGAKVTVRRESGETYTLTLAKTAIGESSTVPISLNELIILSLSGDGIFTLTAKSLHSNIFIKLETI